MRTIAILLAASVAAALAARWVAPDLAALAYLGIGILCASELVLIYQIRKARKRDSRRALIPTGVALTVVLALYGITRILAPDEWRQYTVATIVFVYAIMTNWIIDAERRRAERVEKNHAQ